MSEDNFEKEVVLARSRAHQETIQVTNAVAPIVFIEDKIRPKLIPSFMFLIWFLMACAVAYGSQNTYVRAVGLLVIAVMAGAWAWINLGEGRRKASRLVVDVDRVNLDGKTVPAASIATVETSTAPGYEKGSALGFVTLRSSDGTLLLHIMLNSYFGSVAAAAPFVAHLRNMALPNLDIAELQNSLRTLRVMNLVQRSVMNS